MSRVVDRQFILNNDEKERFRKLLRRVEGFSGVDVLTFCVLDTHFHALLHVPEREDYTEGQARGVSETGGPTKPGFRAKEVEAVLKADGKLTMQQALHCRVRYLSDGLVLGSRSYVDEVFRRHRQRFSAKRQTGARPMRWVDFGGLYTARRLRLDVISISP